MTTLTITRGLPGSGKSTWARTQPGWRVNRDDLRAMLLPSWPHGFRACEEILTEMQHAAITALLRAGTDVICDDTNLPQATIDALWTIAWDAGADVVVHDLRGLPVDLCVARDADRPVGERVGEDRIRAMAAAAGLL